MTEVPVRFRSVLAMKKPLRRVYTFARSGGTLSALAEVSGAGCLTAAGWLFHPIAGLVVAGAMLLFWAGGTGQPRSK